MNSRRKTIVVFFYARYSLPLRSANEAHLRSWGRYSKHRVIYINVGFGVPWTLLRRLSIDTVVFDTIFLSMHWSPEHFERRAAECLPVRDLPCLKIAVPQDEFINIDLVVEFLARIGVTHVLTCAKEVDWPKFYGRLDLSNVQLRRVLTGYVDETRLSRVPHVPLECRSIDVGYRAWNNPYWLGDHGTEKVRIGRVVGEAARKRGLKVDVNNPSAQDFLIGGDWFAFLLRCRAVLGVEGGASLLDRDGSVRARTEQFMTQYPGATYEEARRQCFPDADHEIDLACLSPRHFEASLTRTCQVLLEGDYNGVFQAWKHYIPIKKDYSNVEEALNALEDDATVERITNQAYEDHVASGHWSYRRFIADIEEQIIDPAFIHHRHGLAIDWLCGLALKGRATILWKFVHLEASRSYAPVRQTVVSVFRVVREPFRRMWSVGKGLCRVVRAMDRQT